MTTKVIVEANNGFPVRVMKYSVPNDFNKEVKYLGSDIVEPNKTGVFYIYDGLDIKVHEIQPNEQEKEKENV